MTLTPDRLAAAGAVDAVKTYGFGDNEVHALAGVTAHFERGHFTAIMGPSGSGKSTLMHCMAGLDDLTSGAVYIGDTYLATLNDKDLTKLRRSQVGFIFQAYNLVATLTAEENITLPLLLGGQKGDQAWIDKVIDTVGLRDRLHHRPSELSGGQQQRVAVARSLVLEPSVLLFDEPLSNLDARLRRSMREEIRTLQQRLKLTVAYVTHDQSEALAVSDQIVVMNGGLIAQAGTPQQLYEEPGSEFVAGFMGEAMLFSASADDTGMVTLGPLRLRARRAVKPGAVKVAVRPEAWQVLDATSASGPAGPGLGHGTVSGTLAKTSYLGNLQELTVATELGELFVVSPDVARRWALGERLTLALQERGVSIVNTGA